ncbi:uncharacterized protein LOC132727745 isoform X3 [Ruditapes philippinarum]|uniref:uncharacterized protein LOC132727745 isoform X3 n=1 Tax=Ruditapes philippinarum TaxID=129788 RepID=UPI00295AD7E1|nr:uncharacterized protein LOC132727745 isoform X3 [Ruditapes philippinarum]
MYVNVSTTPVEDPLYRLIPKINRRYAGGKVIIYGDAQVRVRAWKQSSLPVVNFHQSGIKMKANTSKVSDSYAEVSHNLGEMPCLVIVRIKMHHGNNLIMADGVGSSMQVYADVSDRTNAYLVYGYSNNTVRMWVDSSNLGAIFDGRKHTWFDIVMSEGEAEIFAWKCSTNTPFYNARVVIKNTMDKLPEWWNLDVDYELEYSLIRVSVLAETPEKPNSGFRFPAGMYLGYPEPPETGNTVGPVSVGGLSYAYELRYKFNFWQPKFSENLSSIFIAESFGDGKNTEVSHSESVYILSWIYEENAGCPEPVIPNGFANTSLNGTSTGSHAIVRCDEGYDIKQKKKYYGYDYERYNITCHKFGYWENIPSCIPKEKAVDSDCNPAVDRCRDQHATCTLTPDRQRYRCTCNDGYKNENGRCKAKGIYLPTADYDSDWTILHRTGPKWHLEFEHGLGTVPVIVDVQVEVDNVIFHAIGQSPARNQRGYDDESTVVYIYDENFVNVSAFRPTGDWSGDGLFSRGNYKWYGYANNWGSFGYVRVLAWKAESLPEPDILDNTKTLRANTSKASDSFYELEHSLGEYPGIVVVRAKMEYSGKTFYADGVGSALNIFSASENRTTAYLVYGYSDSKIRAWVDSSTNGAIFDGRRDTYFDMIISEAVLEIYAWKISTITPFFTYMFSLEEDRILDYVDFFVNYDLGNGLTVATAQIMDVSSHNKDFRFPSTAFLADRYGYIENKTNVPKCIFGGFTVAYATRSWSLKTEERQLLLYKPINFKHSYEDFGALLCIPDTFGGGTYADAAHNGIGILHSWINGDCGEPPEQTNGYLNTTVNGTEIGAFATLECYDGYSVSSGSQPVCMETVNWKVDVRCKLVECGEVEAPTNGTLNVSGLTFGNNVTFQCEEGYKINGTNMITCLSTGSWSASVPTCTVDDDTDGDNGSVSSSNDGRGCLIMLLLVTTLTSIL